MPKAKKGRIFEHFMVCGLKPSAGLLPLRTGSLCDADSVSDLQKLVSPLQQTYVPSVLQYLPTKDVHGKLDFQAITTLCFPHGVSLYEHVPAAADAVKFHPFIITRENGSKVHAAALTLYDKVEDEAVLEEMNKRLEVFHRDLQRTKVGRLSGFRPLEQLHATKCLCFILSQPFHRTAESVLNHIYSVAMSIQTSKLPLESYVYNLLYEVPAPSPGKTTRLHCGKNTLICYRPGDQELPILDYPLSMLISAIGVQKLVSLFNCAMLEQRILVTSSDYYRLMLVCECIAALLFPFTWAHVYVPILPASRMDFLDAPVPFIMGLCKADCDDEDDEEIAACERCTVDIDSGKVEVPEDVPVYPHSDELINELEDLCIKYGVKVQNHQDKDNDSGMSSQEGSPSQHSDLSNQDLRKDLDFTASSRLAELEAIVKKTGVSVDDIRNEVLSESKRQVADDYKMKQDETKALHDLNMLKFGECVREVFFHCQLRLFAHYEKFVIYPTQSDMSSWLYNDYSREVQNFDKEAFLGDQATIYQPFLCSFLETQMFATFIDHKIMSQWTDPEQSIRVFDLRNLKVNEESPVNSGDDHLRASYERCGTIEDTDELIEKRMNSADYIALAPHSLEGLDDFNSNLPSDVFPELNVQALSPSLSDEESGEDTASSPEMGRRSRHQSEHLPAKPERKPSLALDRQASSISDTFQHFIATLLKEIKIKTNRMLVGKMGEEAVQLGHSDPTLMGLEENTMIANLCDLIERIWSHGLNHKKSKSPLWAHLTAFSLGAEMTQRNQQVDTFTGKHSEPVGGALTALPGSMDLGDLSPVGAATAAATINDATPFAECNDASPLLAGQDMGSLLPTDSVEKTLTHRRKGSNPEKFQTLQPLPTDLLTDIKHIQNMQEIKTPVGKARAFVRLSLEKKLLARHLKELLSNQELLKELYKRTAFLRSEDEREQALFHLLSLNTADYLCFTNAFISCVIAYRVIVIPGKRFAGGISTTTANVWVSVAGQLHDSDRKWLPKNCFEYTFESKNLGQLSTVRIGHDNSGMAPKWLVDQVLVRNETTGQIVKFACGRWLGRGVDDDSTERILVGETISYKTAEALLDHSYHNSPRRQKDSPKPARKPADIKNIKTQMQQRLSDSVNNLLKYFHKPEKERESITLLLCGENGLVTRLEEMLSMGFKSARLFRSNLYIWDYLDNVLRSTTTHDSCRSFVANITIINNSLHDVGKDGKLQLLLCLAVRDHLLPEWLHFLNKCPITRQMYEDSAFLLDDPQIQFLDNLLSSLRTYHIQLEPSITKGLDI